MALSFLFSFFFKYIYIYKVRKTGGFFLVLIGVVGIELYLDTNLASEHNYIYTHKNIELFSKNLSFFHRVLLVSKSSCS